MDESFTKCQELILKMAKELAAIYEGKPSSFFLDIVYFKIIYRFVNDICTDFMTETDPASPCSFVDEKRSGQRICTEIDFKRKDCSKNVDIKV